MALSCSQSSSSTRVPIAISGRRTLENGLTVVWSEDHRQPLIAIEARIIGGLRGEGPYLGAGITHFLEHLLFKGTDTRAPGSIDQEVRRYGGTINAFTSHDYTGVTLFVESRYAREALGMLADILQHATFPEGEFQKERAVVISEIQMNRDDPERRIRDEFWSHHLLLHPYRHPILGYQPLLERLTTNDLRTYYHAQYIPNNVVLACVGDLDGATFPALIEETFGSWPRQNPYQVVVPEEPPAVSRREAAEELPVQAGYAMIGFPSTRLAHPDLYPMDVLSAILGQGRSSRLYEDVIRKRQLAQVASSGNYTPFDPGAFTVYLRADPARLDEAIHATQEVIDAIKQHGVTTAELQKAKRQIAADYVFRHQTMEAVADELASSLASTGDPTYAGRYVEEIERVTQEQVQQVARRYLDAGKATVMVIRPPKTAAAAPAPAVEPRLTVTKTVLDNGLTVLVGVDRHLPVSTVMVVGRGGVRVETEETQGLCNLTAQLLLKGTTHHTASEIASTIESLGGSLAAFAGRDAFGVSLDLLAPDLDKGFTLVHELITDSTFPDDELALQRQLVLKELDAREDDIFDLGTQWLRRTLFIKHPYRFDPLGSKQSLPTLRRTDCQAFAKRWLVPSNLVLSVIGDVDPAQVKGLVERTFGRIPRGSVQWPDRISPEPLDRVRTRALRVDKEQSVILLGFRGTRVTAEDRETLDVLTNVLSGMSGRLFQTIREQQGLAYTLGATDAPSWDTGSITVYAATRTEERQKTLLALREQLKLVVDAGVTEEELAQAKRYLIGAYRMDVQQLSGLARRVTIDELYGLGYDSWTQYERRINAVTRDMVHEAARRYVTLDRSAEVVIAPDIEPAAPAESAPGAHGH